MIRTRTRKEEPVTTASHITAWNDIGGQFDYGTYVWTCGTGQSIIIDRSGKRVYHQIPGGSREIGFNPVDHTRWSFKPTTANQIVQTDTHNQASTNGCVVLADSFGKRDAAAFAVEQMVKAYPGPWQGHYDRWEAVKPTMTTRANAFVFLYELRDLKRMFEVIPVKHLKRTWSSLFNKGAPRIISEVLGYKPGDASAIKYLNDAHLNYNFGWKPFLSDVKAFRKATLSFQERLTKFLVEQNRNLTRHKRVMPDPVTVTESSTVGIWKLWYTVVSEYTLSSTFTFSYSLPATTSGVEWRAWLDSMGLNLTAANVWRVIPWSFVVDWFWNVSKFLDQDSTDWLTPWLIAGQSCSSVKYTASFKAWITVLSTGSVLDVGTGKYARYQRVVGWPSFSGHTPDLDADKIRLLASLVGSKIF